MGQYPNQVTLIDRTILLTSEEEVLLQMRIHQYNAPSDTTPTISKATCKVAREVVGGPRGPIVIIVEVIQCKVD
jgi:hypothetical protein